MRHRAPRPRDWAFAARSRKWARPRAKAAIVRPLASRAGPARASGVLVIVTDSVGAGLLRIPLCLGGAHGAGDLRAGQLIRLTLHVRSGIRIGDTILTGLRSAARDDD